MFLLLNQLCKGPRRVSTSCLKTQRDWQRIALKLRPWSSNSQQFVNSCRSRWTPVIRYIVEFGKSEECVRVQIGLQGVMLQGGHDLEEIPVLLPENFNRLLRC